MLVVVVKYLVVRHARRQQRRGRHPRAARAGASARATSAARAAMLVRRCSALFGAALLYGDGMITPAISVLSARRGPRGGDARRSSRSSCRSPSRILIGAVPGAEARHRRHRRGLRPDDAACGSSSIAALGLPCDRAPARGARARSNPRYARRASSCTTAGTASSCSARSCSAITGGEALYADMGHFGRRPIRLAWYARRASRRSCSTTSARARCSSQTRHAASTNPFYALVARLDAATRWSCSRRSRR